MYNLSFEGDNGERYATDRGKSSQTTSIVGDAIPAPIKSPHDATTTTTTTSTKVAYDPYEHGKEEDAVSFWGIVGHLIVISLGPTLLSVPASFVSTGWLLGSVATLATVFTYAYSMRIMIKNEYELCKRLQRPNLTYLEVVKSAFDEGPAQLRWCFAYVQTVVYTVFLCIWVGGNAIIFILAGQNLKNAYDYFFEANVTPSTFNLYLILPLIALCWIPSLKMLVPLSTFTNAVNAVCIVLIMYYTVREPLEFAARPMFVSWTGVSMLMGVQLFSINATCLMIPFKNELKHPKRFKSRFGVITVTYVPVAVIFSLFGLLCYVRYGVDSEDSIILNLPANTFNKTMIALYGVGNCFFFSLIAYASFDIVWNNLLKSIVEKIERPLIYQYVCRTVIASVSIFMALVIPNLSVFLSLTGTVGTSIDSLIIPAMTEMLIYYKRGGYSIYIKDCLIIVFSSVLIVMGGMDSVKQLIETYQ